MAGMNPTPAARHLRSAVAGAVRDGRTAVGWSQSELSRAAGVSTGMVAKVESGAANVTVDLAGRLLSALGVTIDLRPSMPFASPRQRDAVHSQCAAYVQRRLEATGWLVAREVEIVHGRSHGWIDVLAFNPTTPELLVIEVKTEIHDIGRIERTLAWYGRQALIAATKLGWRARSARPWLILLATEENESRLRVNREALAQSFPARAPRCSTVGRSTVSR